jgi:hypothetical protein
MRETPPEDAHKWAARLSGLPPRSPHQQPWHTPCPLQWVNGTEYQALPGWTVRSSPDVTFTSPETSGSLPEPGWVKHMELQRTHFHSGKFLLKSRMLEVGAGPSRTPLCSTPDISSIPNSLPCRCSKEECVSLGGRRPWSQQNLGTALCSAGHSRDSTNEDGQKGRGGWGSG